jgi:hypothetical protein
VRIGLAVLRIETAVDEDILRVLTGRGHALSNQPMRRFEREWDVFSVPTCTAWISGESVGATCMARCEIVVQA